MCKSLFIILFLISSFVAVSFAQWFPLTSGTSLQLESVYFISASTGYVVGESAQIRKTTNGGSTWFSLVSPISGYWLHSLYYPSSGTGYAVGSNSSGRGIIRRGISDAWSTVYVGPDGTYYDFFGVHFLSPSIGYVVGVNGKILKSIDGGTTWSAQSSGVTDALTSVYAIDASSAVAVGFNGKILRTMNGGTNWSQVSSGTVVNLYSLQFTSPSTGFACGGTSGSRVILKTVNGGSAWTSTTFSGTGGLISIYIPSSTIGFVVGDAAAIYKTVNAGVNWVPQTSPTGTFFKGVHFVDISTGYAVGTSGGMIKTTNGGGDPVGIKPVNREIPEKFNLMQNYPNPFNPSTIIRFQIPDSRLVRLVIYDVLGREAIRLFNGGLKPGTYEVEWDASKFTSGTYFYKLVADPFGESGDGAFSATKKMILTK